MKYEIVFYENVKGESPVLDFLRDLEERAPKNKSARIELQQAMLYIELLERLGTANNQNVTKKLDSNIWELRPGNNRIIYFYNSGNEFVLLHQFRKKTQKTPVREIEQAKREVADYLRRGGK